MPTNLTPKEDAESITFANWLRFNNFKFTHIPNEFGLPYRIAARMAAKKKSLGVSPGFPDYVIILPARDNNPPALLFLEMKRQKGSKTSPEQQEWISALDAVDNVSAVIAYGCEDAIRHVEKYVNPE